MKVAILRGDITEEVVDAIVNAANSSLLGGGGVDGAIHRTAGPQLLAACREISRRIGGCRTGDAVITPGFELRARHVIHTVGPVWEGGACGEPVLLRQCYINSLALAESMCLRTVSFPSISTGVYGYPIEKAVTVALDAVLGFQVASVVQVRFVLFSDGDLDVYRQVLGSRGVAYSRERPGTGRDDRFGH